MSELAVAKTVKTIGLLEGEANQIEQNHSETLGEVRYERMTDRHRTRPYEKGRAGPCRNGCNGSYRFREPLTV